MEEIEETTKTPSEEQIQYLRDNPDMAHVFDKHFGAGAAASYLPVPTRGPVPDPEEEKERTLMGKVWRETGGAILYGVQEAANEIVDTVEWGHELAGTAAGDARTTFVLRDEDGNISPDFISRKDFIEQGREHLLFGKLDERDDGFEIDAVAAPETIFGNLVSAGSQFFAGFGVAGKVIKLRGYAGVVIKGAMADAGAFDPDDANLTAIGVTMGLPEGAVTDLLATNPDDPEWMNRARNAVEGAVIGTALDGALMALRGLARARKAARAGDEAKAKAELEEAQKYASMVEQEAILQSAKDLELEMTEAKDTYKTVSKDFEPSFKPKEQPEAPVRTEDSPVSGRDPDQLEMDLGDRPPVQTADVTDLGKKRPILTPDEIESIRKDVWLASKADPETLIEGTAISTMRQFERVEDIQPFVAAIAEVYQDAWAKTPGRWKERHAITSLKGTIQAKKLAEAMGEDPKAFLDRIKTFDGVTMDNLAAEVEARSKIMNGLVKEVDRLSKVISDGSFDKSQFPQYKDMDELMADYQFKMTMARYVVDQNDATASAIGRALNARKLQNRGNEALIRQLSDPYFVNDAKIMAKRHQQMKGEKGWLKEATTESKVKQTLDRINTYRINALLSGPGTQQVNAVSNALNMVMLPTQQIVGGAVTLNAKQMAEGMRTMQGMIASAFEALESAKLAWEMEDAILDPMAQKVEGDIARNDKITGVNKVDQTIRLPSRMLLVMDEFFKQATYRGTVFADAHRIAHERGLKGSNKTKFIKGYVKNSFDADGHAIREDAILQARRATFTEPLESQSLAGMIQRIAVQHPFVRIFVPFIRTPVNLLVTTFQHIPALQYASKRFRDDLKAGGRRAAQARGKQIIGGALLMGLASTVSSGNITGSGPKDPRQRAIWLQNNRPYSIRIVQKDGSVRWVSYRRFEPLANLLSLAADFHEITSNSYGDFNSGKAHEVAAALFMAAAENSVNKTFTIGLSDLFTLLNSGEEYKMAQVGRNLAGSFVPNFLNQMNGDEVLRRARNVLDTMMVRSVGYNSVDPRRDVLGRIVYRPTPKYDPMTMMMKDVVKPDPVMEELQRLGEEAGTQIGEASPHVNDPRDPSGTIDLRDIPYSDTQSMYDRWVELSGTVKIDGMTLEERLTDMIKDPEYLLAPDPFPGATGNTKHELIRKVIRTYRQKAIEEFPELRDKKELAKRAVAMETEARYLENVERARTPTDRLLSRSEDRDLEEVLKRAKKLEDMF